MKIADQSVPSFLNSGDKVLSARLPRNSGVGADPVGEVLGIDAEPRGGELIPGFASFSPKLFVLSLILTASSYLGLVSLIFKYAYISIRLSIRQRIVLTSQDALVN